MVHEHLKYNIAPESRRLYDRIVGDVSRGRFAVDCGRVAPASVSEAYSAVLYDHPELFWLDSTARVRCGGSYGRAECTLEVESIFSKTEMREYARGIERVKQKICELTANCASDEQKELVVCDYFIENIVYEIDNKYNQNAATALVDGKGQCSGIAKAAKLLFDDLGIECFVLNGTGADSNRGTTGPHSWNIIKIGGYYYHLDITYMLGANGRKTRPFNYMYLNYSDARIAANHVWNRSDAPACSRESKPNIPPELSGADHTVGSLYELRELLKNALNSGGSELTVLSAIKAETSEELSRMVVSATRSVLNQSGGRKKISVMVNGSLITFNISD